MLQQNTEVKEWEEMYIKHITIICELASFVVGLNTNEIAYRWDWQILH